MELKQSIIQKDAELFLNKNNDSNSSNETRIGPVYLFTNDDINFILKNSNLSGNVLTVTSSADYALNAILLGAKHIQMFDINRITKYFSEFKITAIKTLSHDEFLKLYNIKQVRNNKFKYKYLNQRIDNDLAHKVCEHIDSEYRLFFDILLENNFFKKEIQQEYYYTNAFPENNMYLYKKNYYLLKSLLKTVQFNDYIDCDIFNLKEKIGKEVYSTILFSNITSYFNYLENQQFLIELQKLEENLTLDGLIQIGYGYLNFDLGEYGLRPFSRQVYRENTNKILEKTKDDFVTSYYHK